MLGQDQGNPHPLALPAGKRIHRAVRKVIHLGHAQGGHDLVLIVRRPLPVPGLVGVPAPSHQVGHYQPIRGNRGLRQNPQATGQIPAS